MRACGSTDFHSHRSPDFGDAGPARSPSLPKSKTPLIFMRLLFGGLSLSLVLWDARESFELYHALLLVLVSIGVTIAYFQSRADVRRTIYFYFCCVFCVFHFGLVPIFLSPDAMLNANSRFGLEWYSQFDLVQQAYSAAILFLAGLIAAGFFVNRNQAVRLPPIQHMQVTHVISMGLLVLSVLLWYFGIFSAGISNYNDYNQYIEKTALGAQVGILHSVIALSFCIAATSGRLLLPFLVFGFWAVVAFPLGLRGEVTFTFIVVMSILISKGRFQIPIWVLGVFAAAFLAISAFVSVLRVSDTPYGQEAAASISEGIAELGSSLRPVREVVVWLQTGDDYRLGATYYAPFERTFLRIFPIVPRIEAESDDRLMNVLIMHRLGPYGFSIAAEALYNFGLVGCLAIGAIAGFMLIKGGELLAGGGFQPVSTAIIFGLFNHIRQSFMTGYAVAAGIFIICIAIAFAVQLLERTTRLGPRSEMP